MNREVKGETERRAYIVREPSKEAAKLRAAMPTPRPTRQI
jgi:hypothetical protein